MIGSGLKAKLTCVDSQTLSSAFVGREFDEQLLSDLPPKIDPCGENGEFHSFVYAAPIFRRDIRVTIGEIAYVSPVEQRETSAITGSNPVPTVQDGVSRCGVQDFGSADRSGEDRNRDEAGRPD
jgi:Diphthamide synthase